MAAAKALSRHASRARATPSKRRTKAKLGRAPAEVHQQAALPLWQAARGTGKRERALLVAAQHLDGAAPERSRRRLQKRRRRGAAALAQRRGANRAHGRGAALAEALGEAGDGGEGGGAPNGVAAAATASFAPAASAAAAAAAWGKIRAEAGVQGQAVQIVHAISNQQPRRVGPAGEHQQPDDANNECQWASSVGTGSVAALHTSRSAVRDNGTAPRAFSRLALCGV
jgi:hypothetical protein